jgi:hypothetical protein
MLTKGIAASSGIKIYRLKVALTNRMRPGIVYVLDINVFADK